MQLKELVKSIDILECAGDMNRQIKGVSCNSKNVRPGALFIAIKGFVADGHLFIKEAIEKGAHALIIENKRIWRETILKDWSKEGIWLCLVPDSRYALAMIADEFYKHPSRDIKVIGITGTNGKTTTCLLISKILEVAGQKPGWITTVNYRIDRQIHPSQRTTPESIELQENLSEMIKAGCRWAVVEVSSHSLVLKRVAGCKFTAAVMTNITRDHLDFHKTTQEYRMAKTRLFEMIGENPALRLIDKVAVLNADDPESRKILSEVRSKYSQKTIVLSYGIENDADVHARGIEESIHGLRFQAITPWGSIYIVSPLIGKHNIYNILAALCVTLSFGIETTEIQEGIKQLEGVPGRFERIMMGQAFEVIIDYAHTHDALSNLLSAVRRLAKGKIICVFGCGGDRDKSKRPLMGRVAARQSDWTILTSDNPRSEDPGAIIKEIEEGFLQERSDSIYEVFLDRREAIRRAVSVAGAADIVVIAGKGHEKTQVIGNTLLPFDDRRIATQAINNLVLKEAFNGTNA